MLPTAAGLPSFEKGCLAVVNENPDPTPVHLTKIRKNNKTEHTKRSENYCYKNSTFAIFYICFVSKSLSLSKL